MKFHAGWKIRDVQQAISFGNNKGHLKRVEYACVEPLNLAVILGKKALKRHCK